MRNDEKFCVEEITQSKQAASFLGEWCSSKIDEGKNSVDRKIRVSELKKVDLKFDI